MFTEKYIINLDGSKINKLDSNVSSMHRSPPQSPWSLPLSSASILLPKILRILLNLIDDAFLVFSEAR